MDRGQLPAAVKRHAQRNVNTTAKFSRSREGKIALNVEGYREENILHGYHRDLIMEIFYLVAAMFGLEDSLENSEHRRLEHHPWHFAVPRYPMKHLVHVMIHLVRVLVELLQENQHRLHDLHIGESWFV